MVTFVLFQTHASVAVSHEVAMHAWRHHLLCMLHTETVPKLCRQRSRDTCPNSLIHKAERHSQPHVLPKLTHRSTFLRPSQMVYPRANKPLKSRATLKYKQRVVVSQSSFIFPLKWGLEVSNRKLQKKICKFPKKLLWCQLSHLFAMV